MNRFIGPLKRVIKCLSGVIVFKTGFFEEDAPARLRPSRFFRAARRLRDPTYDSLNREDFISCRQARNRGCLCVR